MSTKKRVLDDVENIEEETPKKIKIENYVFALDLARADNTIISRLNEEDIKWSECYASNTHFNVKCKMTIHDYIVYFRHFGISYGRTCEQEEVFGAGSNYLGQSNEDKNRIISTPRSVEENLKCLEMSGLEFDLDKIKKKLIKRGLQTLDQLFDKKEGYEVDLIYKYEDHPMIREIKIKQALDKCSELKKECQRIVKLNGCDS